MGEEFVEIKDLKELKDSHKEILKEAVSYELEYITEERDLLKKEVEKYENLVKESQKELDEIPDRKREFEFCEKRRLACEEMNRIIPFKFHFERRAIVKYLFKNTKSPIFNDNVLLSKIESYRETLRVLKDRLEKLDFEEQFLLNFNL